MDWDQVTNAITSMGTSLSKVPWDQFGAVVTWLMKPATLLNNAQTDINSATHDLLVYPRGIRNNNPLNLSYVPGQYGVKGSDGRFGVYGSEADGVTAAANQLKLDQSRGAKTLAQLITSWAPPNENDTAGYIKKVSQRTGITPGGAVDLNNPRVLAGLLNAMAIQETGRPIPSPVLAAGVNNAGTPDGVQRALNWLAKPANDLFTHDGSLSPRVNAALANLRAGQRAASGSQPITINNHLGPITVNTQATDARGTADAVSHSVQKVLVTNSKKGLR